MNKKIIMGECKQCGYQWIPRSLNRPARCPKCQSKAWDKPIKREGG